MINNTFETDEISLAELNQSPFGDRELKPEIDPRAVMNHQITELLGVAPILQADPKIRSHGETEYAGLIQHNEQIILHDNEQLKRAEAALASAKTEGEKEILQAQIKDLTENIYHARNAIDVLRRS